MFAEEGERRKEEGGGIFPFPFIFLFCGHTEMNG